MRGQKARPLVNSNVSSTNIWCKLSHCCRSLSHDWMSLDRFGQADELFLLCWSHCLCINYASPFGTHESAWDTQWWNLRPSPTVRHWLAWDAFKEVPSLWQSQTRHTFYISPHWSLDPWTGKRGPQRTRQLPSCWPKMKLPLTDWYTLPRTPNVQTFLKDTFHLHQPHSL